MKLNAVLYLAIGTNEQLDLKLEKLGNSVWDILDTFSLKLELKFIKMRTIQKNVRFNSCGCYELYV